MVSLCNQGIERQCQIVRMATLLRPWLDMITESWLNALLSFSTECYKHIDAFGLVFLCRARMGGVV